MRTYLDCPYSEKDAAKELGARWDSDEKKWYVPGGMSHACFARWLPGEKQFLKCPYSEKDEAKKLGARWDAESKQWYVPNDVPIGRFSRWLPSTPREQTTVLGYPISGDSTQCETCGGFRDYMCEDIYMCMNCGT